MPPRAVRPSQINPGPGQMALIEREGIPRSMDMGQRHNFSTLATPAYWDLKLEDYADVTPAAAEAASPDKLRPSLLSDRRIPVAPSSNEYVTWYTPEGERFRRYVALIPREFAMVAGSVDRLGQVASASVLRYRPSRHDFVEDHQAARRGGVHAVERVKAKLHKYVDGTIDPNLSLIDRYLESSSRVWAARRSETTTRRDVAWIRQEIFGGMLEAIGHVRGWTPEQAELARKSVDYRLFLMRAGNRHLDNWQDMLELAKTYNANKRALFLSKIAAADVYIQKHTPDQSEVQ